MPFAPPVPPTSAPGTPDARLVLSQKTVDTSRASPDDAHGLPLQAVTEQCASAVAHSREICDRFSKGLHEARTDLISKQDLQLRLVVRGLGAGRLVRDTVNNANGASAGSDAAAPTDGAAAKAAAASAGKPAAPAPSPSEATAAASAAASDAAVAAASEAEEDDASSSLTRARAEVEEEMAAQHEVRGWV